MFIGVGAEHYEKNSVLGSDESIVENSLSPFITFLIYGIPL